MSKGRYSEEEAVQKPAGELLRKMGWELVYAYNDEALGQYGILGHKSYREVVLRNWFLGKRTVGEELHSATRSELYGREVIDNLSRELNAEYGKGFGRTSLYQFAKFYRLFPKIVHGNRVQSPSLTWTHYRHLLRVGDAQARAWYEREAIEQSWAEKTLDRNIATQYYHRMLKTADKNKPSVEEEMRENTAMRA